MGNGKVSVLKRQLIPHCSHLIQVTLTRIGIQVTLTRIGLMGQISPRQQHQIYPNVKVRGQDTQPSTLNKNCVKYRINPNSNHNWNAKALPSFFFMCVPLPCPSRCDLLSPCVKVIRHIWFGENNGVKDHYNPSNLVNSLKAQIWISCVHTVTLT